MRSKINKFRITAGYSSEIGRGYQGGEVVIVTKESYVSLDEVLQYMWDHSSPADYADSVTTPLGFSVRLTHHVSYPDEVVDFATDGINFDLFEMYEELAADRVAEKEAATSLV